MPWVAEYDDWDYLEAQAERYGTDDEHGTIYVEPRCPQCQRFIRIARVTPNGLGKVMITATCKRCGPVQPEYECN